jgi:hypothetical protein
MARCGWVAEPHSGGNLKTRPSHSGGKNSRRPFRPVITILGGIFVRAKSGKMPDLTGWKPVPPEFESAPAQK